jgi:hypothetical protein
MPKFEATDSKGQNTTAFTMFEATDSKGQNTTAFTMFFLSYYEVYKRHTHLEVSSQMCWDLMAFNEP